MCELEPTSVGGSIYEFTDNKFPVFVEDVRKRNMQAHLEELDTDITALLAYRRAATSSDAPSQRKMFTLSPAGKAALLKLTADDAEVGDRRTFTR